MHEQISEVFCTDIARWNIGEESGVPLGEFVACIALRLRAVAVQNCGSTSSCLGRSIAITWVAAPTSWQFRLRQMAQMSG